jgi:RNA polymerase sigma-70 factor (ECF subfamily)
MTAVTPTLPSETDPGFLLGQIARGSREAFAGLFDEMAPLVYAVSRALLTDPALAERATEEAFLLVWQRAAQFDEDLQDANSWVMAACYLAVVRQRRALRA